MSADRELLELAAKAAGHQFDSTEPFEIFVPNNCFGDNWREWNPLTDDGDALRLAVQIDACISINKAEKSVRVILREGLVPLFSEHITDNAEAATRRAIVRAAAEIGKAMP